MTNFISIPVTPATPGVTTGNRLINLNALTFGLVASGTTVGLYTTGENFTLTTTTDGANKVLDAINAAIGAVPGGQVVQVEFPTNVKVLSVTVVA
jgi:hypothetical protein